MEDIILLGKVWVNHCETIEELLMKVHDECEVRGLNAQQTIEVVKEVKVFAVQASDFKAGIRDCKAGLYDKWYRYNRKDDGAAYDKGWMQQNKTTKCEKVTFLNA